MRKFLTSLFVALMVIVFMSATDAQAQSDDGKKIAAEKVTLEGELIDVRCYSAMGARGEKHEMCANACAKAGDPVGILTKDGKLYTIGAISSGFDGIMAKTAKVEGTLFGNVLIPKKVTVDGKEHKLKKEMM